MQVAILSSGSKGNCTLVKTDSTKILIDLGVTKNYAEEKLKELNVDPSEISAIFITHTHVDHIQGLKVFLKKYHPSVYVTEEIMEILDEYDLNANYVLYDSNKANVGDLNVSYIKISHDAKEDIGFIISDDKKSMVYITDTGYINNKYFDKLSNHDLYLLESNHDVEMLMNGKYPYHLKKRILGNKGHLSNDDAGYYLSEFIGSKTKTVILAHLSDDNNTYDKAYDTVSNILKSKNIKIKNILIAKQKQRTELIEV